jgi:hypothetical protein
MTVPKKGFMVFGKKNREEKSDGLWMEIVWRVSISQAVLRPSISDKGGQFAFNFTRLRVVKSCSPED